MNIKQAKTIFEFSGFKVEHIKEIHEGYFENGKWNKWFLVKTVFGWIEIGWRDNKLSINWFDTGYRGKVTDDDVIMDDHYIYALSSSDAVKYMTTLYHRLDNKGIAQ